MEGNLGKEILRKKKDRNEKFYFGKVEALASIVPKNRNIKKCHSAKIMSEIF